MELKIKLPCFQRWFKLEDYKGEDKRPVVYIIRNDEPLKGSEPDVTDNKIIYIGETKNERVRLRDFKGALQYGKTGNYPHSGGCTANEKGYKISDLWVSCWSIETSSGVGKKLMGVAIEGAMLLNYSKRNGDLPECNSKEREN